MLYAGMIDLACMLMIDYVALQFKCVCIILIIVVFEIEYGHPEICFRFH